MKPDELQRIEVKDVGELTAKVPDAFLRVWRYRLQNHYTNSNVSGEYDFDLVTTRFSDAVVVVIYHRDKDGKILVGLRRGTRPAVYLRHLHTKGKETPISPVFLETVAGGVEEGDLSRANGILERAATEVFEESDFPVRPAELVRMGSAAFSAPGFTIERIHFFCVEIDPVKRRETPTTEDIHEEVAEVVFREISEALSMCRNGEIADQKTEVALFRFASWIGAISQFGVTGECWQPDEQQVQILCHLRERAWASFDERRRHEYKISLTLWAIYVASIGLVLTKAVPLPVGMKVALLGGLLLLAWVYVYWSFHLAKTQQLDRSIAIYYGEKLLNACLLREEFYTKFPLSKGSRLMSSEAPGAKLTFGGFLKNWNHFSEVAVTLILTLASVLLVLFSK